jgi:TatD DNase family protein
MIDIGVNLAHKSFRADLSEVVRRALDAGVTRMVATGTGPEESERAQRIAATRPGVLFSTAGVHPHNAKRVDADTIPLLRRLSERPEVVAIGECGLDYDRDFSPRDVQRRVFESQLELAVERRMPVFLHEREAHGDFVRILEKHRGSLPGGVVHCFTGSAETLHAYLELDMHIGITGWICDERRGKHLFGLVERIPPNRLFVETDAPFLLPRDLTPKPRHRRNEPMHLPHVLRTVARAAGRDPEGLARQTLDNARSLFGIE